MALQPLIEPSLKTVGSGQLTMTKLADFDAYNGCEGDEKYHIKEACYEFVATPNDGWVLDRISVHCVINGRSSTTATEDDLTSDLTKNVSNGYVSYWWEDIEGKSHDTDNGYWTLTAGELLTACLDAGNFLYPHTSVFDVTAYFKELHGKGLIYVPGSGNLMCEGASGRLFCYE